MSTIASFATEAGNPGAKLVSEHPDEESIEIIDIQANAPGNDGENPNGEFATLQNTGDGAIDMSGFILSFEGGSGQNYTFGEFTLGAGKTVTIRNGSGENTDSTIYSGLSSVLNNGSPDLVVIANDERVILDQESY